MRVRGHGLGVLALVGAAAIVVADLPGAAAPAAHAAECGVEKWSIKTASDPEAGDINQQPTATTVEALRAIARPDFVPADQRVRPTEVTTYRVTATLRQYKVEDDSDVHLVLEDSAGRTLITELAHPDCVSPASPLRSQIVAARNAFLAAFSPTTSWKFSSSQVTVAGVGFFDYLHGQTGVSPNGIELHPMTAFNVGAAQEPTASPTASASPTPSESASPGSPTPTPSPSHAAPAGVGLQTNVSEITAGNRPILSGLVTDSAGQAAPGVGVDIYQKLYAQTSYSVLTTTTSDATGQFFAPVAPTKQAAYVARAGGASSPSVVIRVHSRITVSSPAPGTTVAARTTFSGSLNPVYPGVAMGLAVIRSGRYTYLGQGTVNASGQWSITANLPAGTYPYVVYTSAHSGTLYGSKSLTLTVQSPPAAPTPSQGCDPAYPDVCIPPPPPDLDCGDISYRRFRVLSPDPHGFDTDHDGIGCET